MKIGVLARATGTKVETIRFYEGEGLLPAPARTASNYRTYAQAHLDRLALIKRSRDLGFTMKQVRELLRLSDNPDVPCDEVDRITASNLAVVDRKLTDLSSLRGELVRRLETCPAPAGADCQIIDALSTPSSRALDTDKSRGPFAASLPPAPASSLMKICDLVDRSVGDGGDSPQGSVSSLTARDRARIARRSAILEQAALIVGERGYHGFGLRELAKRCGLTKAGLLHHFASKDRLLIDVLRDRDRQDELAIAAIPGIADLDGGGPGSITAVLASLRAIVARNATRPAFVRLYAMLRAEALHTEHPAHSYFRTREAGTLEVFTLLLASHIDHPRSVARQINALMTGLELQWLREDHAFDLVAEWDLAIAALLPEPVGRASASS